MLDRRIATAMRSDVGKVRTNNEDSIAEAAEIGVLVLADGMGGYNAGEIASAMATRTVVQVMRDQWGQPPPPDSEVQTETQVEAAPQARLLEHAVRVAHRTIYQASQSNPEMAGMGTTVVAALFNDNRLFVAHVGDSRLYRYRFGQLQQLTRDHSLLEELVARGHFSREHAATVVRRNIVTRALGSDVEVEVDLSETTLEVGDLLLLCSDGLTDMVSDEAIALSLRRYGDDLPAAADKLVEQALAQGGKDNVSVILARMDQSFSHGRPWYSRLMDWL